MPVSERMSSESFTIYFIYHFIFIMNIYVGNLNYRVKENELKQALSEFGTVDSVKIVTARETGRSKGFAFVEMPNDEEASKVIAQLNGAEYAGRQVVIREATPRAPREPREPRRRE